MGLVGDLQEARILWKKASWPFRCGLIITTFLATGSLAGLSDVVFQWKGFILDAIHFYHTWVTDPIIVYAKLIGLIWDRLIVDYVIMFGLLLSGFVRVLILLLKTKGSLRNRVWVSIYIVMLITLIIFCSALPFEEMGHFMRVFPLVILTGFLVPFLLQFPPKIKAIFYTPFILAISFVLILGAINAGLSRPLP